MLFLPIYAFGSVELSNLLEVISSQQTTSETLTFFTKALDTIDEQDENGLTALIWAAWEENNTAIEVILKHGANPNIADNRGRTPLIISVLKQNITGIQTLIQYEADTNQQDHLGMTPLMWAVSEENLHIISMLLCTDANPNIKDAQGRTALIWAARKGKKNILGILLKVGANQNEGDLDGNTPLMHATQYEHLDIIQFLLHKDIDINATNKKHETALLQACKLNKVTIVQTLLEAGASFSIHSSSGRTPLMATTNLEIAKMLIGSNIDIHTQDNEGKTALMWAIWHRAHDLAEYLIKQGALIETYDSQQTTPFHIALLRDTQLSKKFLALNFFKQGKDVFASNLLMQAAKHGNIEIIENIIEITDTIHETDDFGAHALMQAAINNHDRVVKLLLKHHVNLDHLDFNHQSSLMYAAKNDNDQTQSLQILLEAGIPINAHDMFQNTALHIAIEHRNANIATMLLKYKADVNAVNEKLETPLIIAAKQADLTCIDLLLEYHARATINDIDEKSPLMWTIIQSKNQPITTMLTIIKKLLKADVHINHQDRNGLTALMWAVIVGQPQIIKLLHSNGANLHCTNNNNQTAYELACEQYQVESAYLLEQLMITSTYYESA